jgi:hypothetical protein
MLQYINIGVNRQTYGVEFASGKGRTTNGAKGRNALLLKCVKKKKSAKERILKF